MFEKLPPKIDAVCVFLLALFLVGLATYSVAIHILNRPPLLGSNNNAVVALRELPSQALLIVSPNYSCRPDPRLYRETFELG
jgi:hypothetical protein